MSVLQLTISVHIEGFSFRELTRKYREVKVISGSDDQTARTDDQQLETSTVDQVASSSSEMQERKSSSPMSCSWLRFVACEEPSPIAARSGKRDGSSSASASSDPWTTSPKSCSLQVSLELQHGIVGMFVHFSLQHTKVRHSAFSTK